MIIDNFEQIKGLLEFPNEDTFYHLQIIRRGKDHPNLPCANRTIMTYYLDSSNKLDKLKEEIIGICKMFGARAYINLNPRSYKKTTMDTIAALAHRVSEGDYKKIYRTWNTVCSSEKSKNARWIIDVDEPNEFSYEEITEELISLYLKNDKTLTLEQIREPEVLKNYIIAKIPTKNGYHLITKGFNREEFSKKFGNKIDIHRNNPTILYIPEIKND